MSHNKRRLLLFFVTVFAILVFIFFVPIERIYVIDSKPVIFAREENVTGIAKATNELIAISYGPLLNQKKERYFAQRFIFNSSEYASSYYSRIFSYFPNATRNETEFTPPTRIETRIDETSYIVVLLKENKIIYVRGNKEKIEKVVEWLLARE